MSGSESTMRPGGRGAAYPEDIKRDAVRLLAARKADGIGIVAVARELGLKPDSLRRWSRAAEAEVRGKPAFREVAVVARRAGGTGAAVVFVGDLRIEGLSVAEIAELARALR